MYFSKVEFTERFWNECNILLLNIPAQELSYQKHTARLIRPPVITGQGKIRVLQQDIMVHLQMPARFMRNGHNHFLPVLLPEETMEFEVSSSKSIRLLNSQMENLLPLCVVEDYEPYRNAQRDLPNRCYRGYRDELRLTFRAVSDSPYPLLKWSMNEWYDDEHTLPSERLYMHLQDLLRNTEGKPPQCRK